MIICSGECLIDMLPRQLPGGEDVFLPASGGAVFNTAIALGRLGQPAAFLSGISNDLFGEQLMGSLADSHVDTRYAIRSDRPTTLAFVKLTNGQAQYSFVDENTAGRMISPQDLPVFSDTPKAMHFGAISLIPDTCGSTYEALMEREHPNTVISLDPNIRPGFVSDPAPYRARLARMMAMSDIIKVSDEDLSWLAPDANPEAFAAHCLEKGCSLVVITTGEKGARILTPEQDISMPAKSAELVDTVGAGDSFNAGLLTSLNVQGSLDKKRLSGLSEDVLATALDYATRVAAVTVSRAGANPPWAHEL